MKLVIVHFHLAPGGVTQVIQNHLRSLAAVADISAAIESVLILHGGRTEGWQLQLESLPFPVSLQSISSLEYEQKIGAAAESLSDDMLNTLASNNYGPADTLVHFHNHSLGKSWPALAAIERLANAGYYLFLHIHDFAEDFRPDNFRTLIESAGEEAALSEKLYPQAGNIHYGVLNGRDFTILTDAGIATARLHLLSNPAPAPPLNADRDAAREKYAQEFDVSENVTLFLYPVRGIRRKNVGEMLLWSAVADPSRHHFAITLPPVNPVEATSYQELHSLAKQLELPCSFDVGQRLSFAENLVAADAILTTSVAEGFGMVFLEAWLAGKPLVGRDLPEITAEFKQPGIVFPDFYQACWIPLKLLSQDDDRGWLQPFLAEYEKVAQAYGKPLPTPAEIDAFAMAVVQNRCIDFAYLSLELQLKVIREAKDPAAAAAIREANPVIQRVLQTGATSSCIDSNAAMVSAEFGVQARGKHLLETYQRCLASTPSSREQAVDPSRVLSAFLKPERFHPLRVSGAQRPVQYTVQNSVQDSMQNLIQIFQQQHRPLEAQPTSAEAKLPKLTDIRAVLFDIYGTLVISGSGDIGLTAATGHDAAFSEAITAVGGTVDAAISGGAELEQTIRADHAQAKQQGIEYPEVDIVQIWSRTLERLQGEGKATLPSQSTELPGELSGEILEALAVHYESRVNPTDQMPGMPELLERLSSDFKLGIVSNAQFFTPLLFPAITGKTLDEFGLAKDLRFYSFAARQAKPGTYLYEQAVEVLQTYAIAPDQVLYVGNDLLNDITPAAQVGFRTVLFAGDARSLRLREGDPRVAGVVPDATITELAQLLEILY